jgi:uncharacterized protein YgiM (DUF1202 family)
MRSFRSRLLGRPEDEDVRYETTMNLNIRTGPGTQHEKIIDGPLPTGTRVEIVGQKGTWRLVDVLDVIDGIMDLQG